MEYIAYKMKFKTAVHFGNKTLESSDCTFMADTLFSALCHEAVAMGEDTIDSFVSYVKNNELVISDGMPYIGKTLFIPKPMLQVEKQKEGDSKVKKAFKNLKYIPVDKIDEYLLGTADIEKLNNEFDNFGTYYAKTQVKINEDEDNKPYRVGIFEFNKEDKEKNVLESGLYFLVGYENEEAKMLFDELLIALSYVGIGGKRSSGLGKFDAVTIPKKDIPETLLNRLNKDGKYYMTLSVSLPREDELDDVIDSAAYSLIKRSGFVASSNYAPEFRRKKDLYVFCAGACVTNKYTGDVYDVSSGGSHPVYKYAKPMFLEVSR